MNPQLPKEPDIGALIAQLAEMNSRARWYASQLWQIALSYFAVVGVTLANITGKNPELLFIALISASVVGSFVFLQTWWLYEGNRRAVRNIQHFERELGVHGTAEHHPWATLPLMILVGLAVLASLIAVVVIWRLGSK